MDTDIRNWMNGAEESLRTTEGERCRRLNELLFLRQKMACLEVYIFQQTKHIESLAAYRDILRFEGQRERRELDYENSLTQQQISAFRCAVKTEQSNICRKVEEAVECLRRDVVKKFIFLKGAQDRLKSLTVNGTDDNKPHDYDSGSYTSSDRLRARQRQSASWHTQAGSYAEINWHVHHLEMARARVILLRQQLCEQFALMRASNVKMAACRTKIAALSSECIGHLDIIAACRTRLQTAVQESWQPAVRDLFSLRDSDGSLDVILRQAECLQGLNFHHLTLLNLKDLHPTHPVRLLFPMRQFATATQLRNVAQQLTVLGRYTTVLKSWDDVEAELSMEIVKQLKECVSSFASFEGASGTHVTLTIAAAKDHLSGLRCSLRALQNAYSDWDIQPGRFAAPWILLDGLNFETVLKRYQGWTAKNLPQQLKNM